MVKIFFTLLSLGFFGIVQAQTLKFSAGYAVPWLSQPIGLNSTSEKITIADPKTSAPLSHITSSKDEVRASYGSGLTIAGAFDYKLSENISIELGLHYVVGKKYSTTSSYTDTQFHTLKSATVETETSQSKAILFTPAIRFITAQRMLTPYFLFGPAFGKINFYKDLGRVIQENSTTSSQDTYTKFKGGISLGLRAGVGMTYVLTSSLSFFTEVVFLGMNYYPGESEITRYVINGEDRLNSLTDNVRKTVYVKRVTSDTREAADGSTAPHQSPRFPIAMSSLTTSAGILVKLQ